MPGISKKNKTLCSKCKKYYNKKQFDKHFKACQGIIGKKYINCPYCFNSMEQKNLKKHMGICNIENEAPELFRFLDFMFYLVLKINIFFLKNGFNDIEKKNLIYKKKIEYIENNIENNKKENYLNREKENYSRKDYINNNKVLLNSIIKKMDIKDYELSIPLISFRQLLIDYIFKFTRGTTICHKISKRVFQYIMTKYAKKNDYKLDSEIFNFELFSLRLNCPIYIEKRNFLFSLFDQYVNKKEKNNLYCIYCGKYVLYKFKHLKSCKGFEEKYNNNKNEIIKEILTTFLIDEYQKTDKELYTIENNFINSSAKEFIENIKVFLNKKRYREFRDKQNIIEKNNIFTILKNIEILKSKIKKRKEKKNKFYELIKKTKSKKKKELLQKEMNKIKDGYDEDNDGEVPQKILDEMNTRFQIKKIEKKTFKKILSEDEMKKILNEVDEQIIKEQINEIKENSKKEFITEYIEKDNLEENNLKNVYDEIKENKIDYKKNMEYLLSQKINDKNYELIKFENIYNENENKVKEINFKKEIYSNNIKNKMNI